MKGLDNQGRMSHNVPAEQQDSRCSGRSKDTGGFSNQNTTPQNLGIWKGAGLRLGSLGYFIYRPSYFSQHNYSCRPPFSG